MAGLTVQLCGGPPWGFRLHGGRGQNIPLTVAKVRRKSKSFGHLLEGDEVSRIGGRGVDGLSHDEAMVLVDSHQDKLEIEVVRRRNASSAGPSTTAGFSAISSPTVIPSTPVIPSPGGETIHSFVEGIASTGLQQALKAPISSVDTPPPQQLSSQQPPLTSQTTQRSAQEFEATTSASQDQSTKFSDHGHYTDSSYNVSHPGEMKTSRGELRSSEPATSSSTTTVNISGAKFDLGSDFAAPTTIGAGVNSAHGSTMTNVVSNPFAGVERILESESKSSKEQIPGGELNRLEKHETKITGDGAYVQSYTLSEHKVSSTSSTTPLSVSVKGGASGLLDDDVLLISPTGRPIKERYYKPLPDEQLKEIDDIMAPILNKKKVFTSSSFYEDANSTYPTVEEQVGMARKIAESLSSDSNAQSKGANMFYRRVKRSHKWVHQAPGISESEYTESEDCSTVPDPDKFPGVKISKEPPKLKLLMAPSASKWEQSAAAQDVTVSPEVCLDIVKGLNSPGGKGSQMFAKRKKKSEDWVVDVDKLKAQLGDKWPEKDNKAEEEETLLVAPPPPVRPPIQAPRIKENSTPADRYLEQISQQTNISRLRLVKSPWEAAMESPIGAVDSAFQIINEPGSVSWSNQLVRTPLAPLSVPLGPEVTAAPLDPLKACSPRGWGHGRNTATQNVCVTVNKKKPPPPPPRPDKARPLRYQPASASTPPVAVVSSGAHQTPLAGALFEIEAGPPAQFFNSYDELSQAPPMSSQVNYPCYPLGNSTTSDVPLSHGSASRLFSPYDCQNFNAAPRGFAFGASRGNSNFRSVRL